MKFFNKTIFPGAILGFAMLAASNLFAQTNPAPQAIPYSQDFSGVAHASTTYPAGIQGWKVSSAATTSFVTTGPTADHTLNASSSASSNAGGLHNYNGKLGTLASGSTNPGLVLALNTTGNSNIVVTYDIMVIRNPYDGGSNTRINEATLQYRVGTSGAFTTLTGIEYQSGTITQTTSGVTTPQDLQSRSITLPAACDNQAEIQIRWITRDMTGGGSRPSFAVDNIVVDADSDADGFVSSVDCDDNNNTVYPGATEICDGLDNDCDASIDEDLASATIDPAGVSVTCKGVGFTFTANDGDGYTHQWYKNGNLIVGATSSTYTTTKPAYYQVMVTIPGGCEALSDAAELNISLNPNANITSPNGLNLCAPGGVKLKASYGASYTYQWYLDGNPILGANAYTYFPSVTGNYFCAVTNEFECSRNTPDVDVVDVCREASIANTNTLAVYPNPATDAINVSFEGDDVTGNAEIVLFNMLGDVVYATNATVNHGTLLMQIDANSLTNGIYLLTVNVNGVTAKSNVVITK